LPPCYSTIRVKRKTQISERNKEN